ncbi:nickel pincer cofactor biosynthesis protein LarC [Thermopirellula anaerolimosa]
MKIAYFDCFSGISGDMILGALVDAGADFERLTAAIDSLALPGCRLIAEEVRKGGFRAKHIRVETQPEHGHRHLRHILELLERSDLTAAQKSRAEAVFRRLAEAEAKVHGTTIEKVHFHEVGAADSIVDVVGAVVCLDLLGVERVFASPVPTGRGTIRIQHGEVSIPAPATAELLVGVPILEADVPFELTTPTGAALITSYAQRFGPPPGMTLQCIGYGAGSRDIPHRANLLRVLIGTCEESDLARDETSLERIWTVETHLDDVPGEIVGYTVERLLEAGALDVFASAGQMKKNRPAIRLTVLCRDEHLAAVESVVLTETTTLGVRRWPVERRVLKRESAEVRTRWGTVAGKVAFTPEGTRRFSPEFESCREAARKHRVPLQVVYREAAEAFARESAANERP